MLEKVGQSQSAQQVSHTRLDKTYLLLVKKWTCQHLEPLLLRATDDEHERKGSNIWNENERRSAKSEVVCHLTLIGKAAIVNSANNASWKCLRVLAVYHRCASECSLTKRLFG